MATNPIPAPAPPTPPGQPVPGWYQDPQGGGMRYWDGMRWTEQRRTVAPPRQPQQAYPITPRVRAASIAAGILSVFLIVGLIGTIATTGDRHSSFDLASKETLFQLKVYRPGAGYLVGPAIILGTLIPFFSKRYLAKSTYLILMILTTVVWAAGLVVALAGLAVLSADDYTIESGMWVALTLLAAGQIANFAMWPFGTKAVIPEPARSAGTQTLEGVPRPPGG